MEYPVIAKEQEIGTCEVLEQGLYWRVCCRCNWHSDQVERLYCGERSVGVLVPENGQLVLSRTLSRSSWPELPPRSGSFSLEPGADAIPWEGNLAGCHLEGLRKGETLLFPYDPEKPCPCEPLLCLFEIKDGFWQLPIKTAERIV